MFAFLLSVSTSRKIAAGELAYMDGYYTILPWVWIPGFLLVPAFLLGLVLFIKMRWTALLHWLASVGLAFGWVFVADSVATLKQRPDSEQAVAGDRR